MVYMGTPYIFYIYMITCGWLGRFILVTHTDDLGWYITSNQQGKMFFQNLNRIVRKPNDLLSLIVKITQNTVIVNVYLQELCYNSLVMNL